MFIERRTLRRNRLAGTGSRRVMGNTSKQVYFSEGRNDGNLLGIWGAFGLAHPSC